MQLKCLRSCFVSSCHALCVRVKDQDSIRALIRSALSRQLAFDTARDPIQDIAHRSVINHIGPGRGRSCQLFLLNVDPVLRKLNRLKRRHHVLVDSFQHPIEQLVDPPMEFVCASRLDR